jgi:YegS/Rv2252/BmrU family lipid kinase
MNPASVKLIINPLAGRRQVMLGVLHSVLGGAGIHWGIAFTHGPGDALRLARAALDEGWEIVAACGGDGTVMEVASALLGSHTTMAILPLGTGNVTATELGIPLALEDAAALIASGSGRVRRIDMGEAGNHKFMLRMGVGFEAALKDNTPVELKQNLGAFSYVLTGLGTLLSPPLSKYTIVVDGTSLSRDGIACIVANSGMTGIAGITLADGVSVSDGLLDVMVVSEATLPTILGKAAEMAMGEGARFERWQGREISIYSSPTREITCDGESAGTTPVTVRVIEGAVGVLVP